MSEDFRQAEAARVMARVDRRHGVPALLSFFIPGLGQMIKGSFLRGIGVWVVVAIASALCFAYVGFAILPLVWIWQIYDAYTAPDAQTGRDVSRLRRSG